MKSLVSVNSLPWLCICDFNEVLHLHEHIGTGQRRRAQIQGFRDAMDVCALANIGYHEKPWTYEKKTSGGGYCRVHLDRALANSDWSTLFPHARFIHETGASSDHCPIRLQLEPVQVTQRVQKIFVYECYWERHDTFGVSLEAMWSGSPVSQSAMQLSKNLEDLSVSLQQWSGANIGTVSRRIKKLKKELAVMQNDPQRLSPSHA